MEEITLPTPPAVSRESFQSVQSVNFSGGKVEGQLWHPKAEGAANANLLDALRAHLRAPTIFPGSVSNLHAQST